MVCEARRRISVRYAKLSSESLPYTLNVLVYFSSDIGKKVAHSGTWKWKNVTDTNITSQSWNVHTFLLYHVCPFLKYVYHERHENMVWPNLTGSHGVLRQINSQCNIRVSVNEIRGVIWHLSVTKNAVEPCFALFSCLPFVQLNSRL